MNARALILSLAALMLLPAAPAQAQQGPRPSATLTAFGSRTEFSAWLRAHEREQQHQRALAAAAAAAASSPCTPATGRAARDRTRGAAVLRGRVTGPSGQPIGGATVVVCVLGGTQRVATAPDGRFRASLPGNRIPAGHRVRVSVSALGHLLQTRQVAMAPGGSATADFTLASDIVSLQEVAVMGAAVAEGRSRDESVTNTQTAGVDEGGIVKVHGDHLVMLRRGRLFTVAIGDGRLAPVSAIDAFAPGMDPEGTWYDEMLVSGDRVVVIGYSYQRTGTEIGVFDIDREGRLKYRATYHLRSNDYYSSRNYASRLIGSKLIFYTPLGVGGAENIDAWLPALRRWHPGARDDEFRPVVSSTRIFRPGRVLDASAWLALHTVTICDLAQPELSCRATALLGPAGRVFYVSGTSVYVWVADGWRAARNRPARGPAMVYRLPLDGSPPSALAVAGSPVDQFSFLEDDGGHLNVLVRSGAGGDGMWSAEHARGDVALLRVPIGRFGDGSGAAPASAYRALPGRVQGYAFNNRFVGRHLLYGGGSGWGGPDRSGRWTLYAVPVAGGRVAEITLPHGVDRIEGMGPDAVVVGTEGDDLHFTGIALGGQPRIRQRYVSPEASQGELRSHGFFYKPDAGDGSTGTIGLPIRGPARPGYEHLTDESASVLFLRNTGSGFTALGELLAHPDGSEGSEAADDCVASCVDWYGNSRPLFLRGRTFALLGYELVEGQVVNGRLREVRRVSYAPRRAEASRE